VKSYNDGCLQDNSRDWPGCKIKGRNDWLACVFPAQVALLRLVRSSHPSQESHVLLQRSASSATVNEWTHALTRDQTGIGKDFKMVRNGRWRDSLKARNITACHLFPGGDSFKNGKSCCICQGF